MFTGDSSGNWLFETLHKFGFATSPSSQSRDDGLMLKDAYVTAAVRCAPPANKPSTEEKTACRPYLLGELSLLTEVRVVVALGKIAFDSYLSARRELGHDTPRPAPRFSHGANTGCQTAESLCRPTIPASRTPTPAGSPARCFEGVFARVRELVET